MVCYFLCSKWSLPHLNREFHNYFSQCLPADSNILWATAYTPRLTCAASCKDLCGIRGILFELFSWSADDI